MKNWTRLPINITHYRGGAYLSMIDCRPGKLAIWRELHAESASAEMVMLERGPVIEVMMDNGTVFRSEIFQTMLKKMEDKKLLQGSPEEME